MVRTLLITDIVDSTKLTQKLGNKRMSNIWIQHDRIARDLIKKYKGTEADRTDGFLILFENPSNAIDFSKAFHKELQRISESENIRFLARIGIHTGEIILIQTPEEDRKTGAKYIEVEGISKPLTARIMSMTQGGQTLISKSSVQENRFPSDFFKSHGFWRLKGVEKPIAILECLSENGQFQPPVENDKAYRVYHHNEAWLPARDIPNNIYKERDSFVGRKKEMVDFASMLEKAESKIITVKGPGGIGKTRFICHYANIWMGEFPGGAWFFDLSEVKSKNGICNVISRVLNIPVKNRDPVLQIGNVIKSRGKCLLIFDNFEQVHRFAPDTISLWADQTREARFVITSRAVLKIKGEHIFNLPPLPFQTDAVELFVNRAKEITRSFDANESNFDDIKSIVSLLDGLPLAIELASSRISLLSAAEIKKRLDQRFKILKGKNDAIDRQQTLRAAIDWSWEMLEDHEKSILAQISIFEGSFNLEAFEDIVTLSALDISTDKLEILQSLIEKSLVSTLHIADESSERRYYLFQSIQEYCKEKIEDETSFPRAGSNLEKLCLERHGEYYSCFGSKEELKKFHGPDSINKRRALHKEAENLFIAFHRSSDFQSGIGVNLLAAIWEILRNTGPLDSVEKLAAELETNQTLKENHLFRVYQIYIGYYFLKNDYKQAKDYIDRSEKLLDQNSDQLGEIFKLKGTVLAMEGDIENAVSYLSGALKIAREKTDKILEETVLDNLGSIHQLNSKLKTAVNYFEEAISVSQNIGDSYFEAMVSGRLAYTLIGCGKLKEAHGLLKKALAVIRDSGNKLEESFLLAYMGSINMRYGSYDEAYLTYRKALQISLEIGDLISVTNRYITLANIEILRSNFDNAQSLIAKAREFSTNKDPHTECLILNISAKLLLRQDKFSKAEKGYRKAAETAANYKNKYQEGIALMGLADTYRELENIAEASIQYENAHKIFSAIQVKYENARLLLHWFELEFSQHNVDRAKNKLKLAQELSKQLSLPSDTPLMKNIAAAAKKMESYPAKHERSL